MDKSSPLKIKGYEDSCPICYEHWSTVSAAPWVLGCSHMICEKCYLKQRLINKFCPICREKYDLKKKRKTKTKRKSREFSEFSWSSLSSKESNNEWNGWNGW